MNSFPYWKKNCMQKFVKGCYRSFNDSHLSYLEYYGKNSLCMWKYQFQSIFAPIKRYFRWDVAVKLETTISASYSRFRTALIQPHSTNASTNIISHPISVKRDVWEIAIWPCESSLPYTIFQRQTIMFNSAVYQPLKHHKIILYVLDLFKNFQRSGTLGKVTKFQQVFNAPFHNEREQTLRV